MLYHGGETGKIRLQRQKEGRVGDIRQWAGKNPAKHPILRQKAQSSSALRSRYEITGPFFQFRYGSLCRSAHFRLLNLSSCGCGFHASARMICPILSDCDDVRFPPVLPCRTRRPGKAAGVRAPRREKPLRPLCSLPDQLFCRRRYSPANSTRAGSTEMKMIMRITREKFCLTKARLPKK